MSISKIAAKLPALGEQVFQSRNTQTKEPIGEYGLYSLQENRFVRVGEIEICKVANFKGVGE